MGLVITKCCGSEPHVSEYPGQTLTVKSIQKKKGPMNHSDKNNSYSTGHEKNK